MIYLKKIKNFSEISVNERHKLQHETAVLMLCEAVFSEYGIRLAKDCLSYTAKGKPYFKEFPNIHFSLAHSGEYAAAALSDRPCGIDIERIGKVNKRLIPRICTEKEKIFLEQSENIQKSLTQLWTLKESYVKAIGEGIAFGLKNIEFNTENGHISSNKEAAYSSFQFEDFIISYCEL